MPGKEIVSVNVCGWAEQAGWSRRRRVLWWGLTLFYLSGMALAAALGLTFLTVDWSTRLLRPELEPKPEYLAMAAFMAGVIFMAALPLGWGLLRLLFDLGGRKGSAGAAGEPAAEEPAAEGSAAAVAAAEEVSSEPAAAAAAAAAAAGEPTAEPERSDAV